MRPRGRIECVHALSSFQRTKAPATRVVRRPPPLPLLTGRGALQGQTFKLMTRLPFVSTPNFQLRRVGLQDRSD